MGDDRVEVGPYLLQLLLGHEARTSFTRLLQVVDELGGVAAQGEILFLYVGICAVADGIDGHAHIAGGGEDDDGDPLVVLANTLEYLDAVEIR